MRVISKHCLTSIDVIIRPGGFESFCIFAGIRFINVWWNQLACKFIDLILGFASSPCWDTAVKLSTQSSVASKSLSVYKCNWLLFTQERLQRVSPLWVPVLKSKFLILNISLRSSHCNCLINKVIFYFVSTHVTVTNREPFTYCLLDCGFNFNCNFYCMSLKHISVNDVMWYLNYLSVKPPLLNGTRPLWWLVNIGSGNGLVL